MEISYCNFIVLSLTKKVVTVNYYFLCQINSTQLIGVKRKKSCCFFYPIYSCKNLPPFIIVVMSDKPCRSHTTHHVVTQWKYNCKTKQVIAWNKHEWSSEGILFQLQKDVNTHHFSSSSPPTLIYSPVWFVCRTKMADSVLRLVGSPVNQTPSKGSIDICFKNKLPSFCSIFLRKQDFIFTMHL